MNDETQTVIRHYGAPGVVARLLSALKAEGRDLATLTAADFRRMDQLHGGGFAATEAMAAFAGLTTGMRILDAGSGLGGSSRYLAEVWGASVEALDLTPEFVAAAAEIDRLCGLESRIHGQVGSVTALPFEDARFDLVWSHYVAMNVSDKAAMRAEAFRVLTPGGRLAIAALAQGPGGEPHFPLPWAREPAGSFLETSESMLAGLEAAGFRLLGTRMPTGPKPGALGDAGLAPKTASMGNDMALREANAARSVAEGRLTPIMVLAERPA